MLSTTLVLLALSGWGRGDDPLPDSALPDARPVPRLQVIPLPHGEASFRHLGRELTRYHFGEGLRRPFLFPVNLGEHALTRMGHPHDPEGHSHHNSLWISHEKVGGENFWGDRQAGRIVHQRVLGFEDGNDEASLAVANLWVGQDGQPRLRERRRMAVRGLEQGDWLLVIDLELEAPGTSEVEIGDSAFGPIGVRMARTIGVHDGGGRILNSEGNRNEAGPQGAFRKPARWMDYSGPIAEGQTAGLTLFDHPSNPNHPCPFHVREDGWMGASPTFGHPLSIAPGTPLRLRYGVWVHRGVPDRHAVEAVWSRFTALKLVFPIASPRR